jgi:hypothetical protein
MSLRMSLQLIYADRFARPQSIVDSSFVWIEMRTGAVFLPAGRDWSAPRASALGRLSGTAVPSLDIGSTGLGLTNAGATIGQGLLILPEGSCGELATDSGYGNGRRAIRRQKRDDGEGQLYTGRWMVYGRRRSSSNLTAFANFPVLIGLSMWLPAPRALATSTRSVSAKPERMIARCPGLNFITCA